MKLQYGDGTCFIPALLFTLLLLITISGSATAARRQLMTIRPGAAMTAADTNSLVKAGYSHDPTNDSVDEHYPYSNPETEKKKQVSTAALAMEESSSASSKQASGFSIKAASINRPLQMTNESSRLRRNNGHRSSSETSKKRLVKRRRHGSSRRRSSVNTIDRSLVDQIDYPSARTHPPTEPP